MLYEVITNDIFGNALGTPDIPVGLIDPSITTDGFATTNESYTLTAKEQEESGKEWTVWTTVDNYYCGNTDVAEVITLAMPGGESVTRNNFV